jgi:hypothetical protein
MMVPRGARRSDQKAHPSRLELARGFLPSWSCEFDSRHPLQWPNPLSAAVSWLIIERGDAASDCRRLGYWRGTPQQYNELYTSTARAARDVLPHGLVGGPAVTSSGLDFLRQFLDYTSLGAAGEMRSPSSTT